MRSALLVLFVTTGCDYFPEALLHADPFGPTSGADHVLRGGGWGYPSSEMRAAYRSTVQRAALRTDSRAVEPSPPLGYWMSKGEAQRNVAMTG